MFAIVGLTCSAFAWRRGGSGGIEGAGAIATRTTDLAGVAPLSSRRRTKWIALSFVPSSLMLAVTTYLSTDIAAVPLLWIVPLSLYLLSFVVVFGGRARFWQAVSHHAMPWLILPLALMTSRLSMPLWVVVPIHLLAFASVAVFLPLASWPAIDHQRPG